MYKQCTVNDRGKTVEVLLIIYVVLLTKCFDEQVR